MRWALVTGGVCSGLGKGCVAAMVARACARAGQRVAYQKLEPCLQGGIESLPNTFFGEIVHTASGASFDGDVARAAFYVPGFLPEERADLSLGRLLADVLARTRGMPAPRFQDMDAVLWSRFQGVETSVVEVGGTAGEKEHRLVCEALRRVLGPPALHVHVTALIASPQGRWTTKPAQLSIEALALPVDLVLVRGAAAHDEELTPLRLTVGEWVPVLRLPEEPDWPERAATRTLRTPLLAQLLRQRLGVEQGTDPLFEPWDGNREAPQEVVVVHDGAGEEGYASLAHRLRAWSRGRLRIRWQAEGWVERAIGVCRIGEQPVAELQLQAQVPVQVIVPPEQGLPPRDVKARPDWWGTADAPEGPLVRFIEAVLAPPRPGKQGDDLAYADPEFAAIYLAASQTGALRDHTSLDALVARALPAGERLQQARVLDVGCGAGRWAARLIAAGAREVVGVEPAPPMAAAAAVLGLERFRLVRGAIEDYQPEGLFDAVLASMSLDHVERIPDVLGRLASHLVPHGRLVVSTEHPLRTAPRSGPRWVEEAGGRAARLRDYGEEGWRTFHWFGHPALVRVYHRTVGSWVALLREVGLELIALHEPLHEDPRDAGNPRFWLLVAKRPGPRRLLVTVDGGAGSGKTTFGQALASRLEWTLLDTGQLQRAFAWRWLKERREAPVRLRVEAGKPRYHVGESDVTEALGGEDIARACADVAREPREVAEMAVLLDELTQERCVITGRAMGRLYGDALARFFLTAPIEVRAVRRGCAPSWIEERDRRDMERGRLLPPDIDSVSFDTGAEGLDKLVTRAVDIVRSRLG
ncbi:MAG: (d)CMP kinase [Myxococcaceae bacterium]|nr:(d)CMP kinase [Myxococcaceae bacterium]